MAHPQSSPRDEVAPTHRSCHGKQIDHESGVTVVLGGRGVKQSMNVCPLQFGRCVATIEIIERTRDPWL